MNIDTAAIDHAAVIALFSGKTAEGVKAALDMLEASRAHGAWIPGYSRKVRAALGKAPSFGKINGLKGRAVLKLVDEMVNVARKAAYEGRNVDKALLKKSDALFQAYMLLAHGQFMRKTDVGALKAYDDCRDLVAFCERYVAAFAPVIPLVQELDAARPKPVFTKLGASPTVTATIERLDAVSVDVCPIRYERRKGIDENGKPYTYLIGILEWPAGTKHGTSRYRCNDRQCEACGHGIYNPCNWVPLVLTAKDGTPKSLWVGRDCAKTLFGVKLDGELRLAEGPGAEVGA